MYMCIFVCTCLYGCKHAHMCVYLLLCMMHCCRSVVSFYEESIKIKAQRTLLQPIQFSVSLSNSLSPRVTSVPSTCIEAKLGKVEVGMNLELLL